ncbi:MAG: hypothetical protein NVS2B16_35630 [Chloroflexota bacterium]
MSRRHFLNVVSTAAMTTMLVGAVLSASGSVHARTVDTPVWVDTTLDAPPDTAGLLCVDQSRPNVFFAVTPAGTEVYNWADGTHNLIMNGSFKAELCGPDGWLYGKNAGATSPVRWSVDHPEPQPIAHVPYAVAADGTSQMYSLDSNPAILWSSEDAGASWHERQGPWTAKIEELAVSPSDARALYVLAADQDVSNRLAISLYFSGDAGATWTLRQPNLGVDVPGYGNTVSITALRGSLSVDDIGIIRRSGIGGGSSSTIALSRDGGKSAREIGVEKVGTRVDFVWSTSGLLRLTVSGGEDVRFERSLDDGTTWQTVAGTSFPLSRAGHAYPAREIQLAIVAGIPGMVLIRDDTTLWFSRDGGTTWDHVPNETGLGLLVTPYLPLTLLGVAHNHVTTLSLPDPVKSLTAGVTTRKASGSTFFSMTQHTLHNLFAGYWHAHGGLAVFGYPKTEAFREYNLADGRIYLVQYFERNRFEYHPELRGTPYDVLLGLLGNQLTRTRREAREAPFQPIADPQHPGELFIPQTGHTLRNSFRRYWEANGGLAIFGYPISNEFEERNPDDGQIYSVQYFERNRFEYHPELKGTQYEVLLGLLGNTLLREKGGTPRP